MSIPGFLLLPLTFLYSLAVRLRNHLYNIGYSRTFRFDVPIILAGNLSAGGSGKTPMIEYLIRLLKDQYKLAVLSRGYKRKTRGFRMAAEGESAVTIGDEPMQYLTKWKDEISVAVGEDRAEAIPKILFEAPETKVVLMDDGFQHRSVTPGFSIITTEYSRPFFRDFLLPSGRLREPRKEIRRADAVVVTKCPDDIGAGQMKEFRNAIHHYKEDLPVFFAAIKYSGPVPLFDHSSEIPIRNVIVVSGIAKADQLESYAGTEWQVLRSRRFADHHHYTLKDIELLHKDVERFKDEDPVILTTEKDAVKLRDPKIFESLKGLPVFYLPIKMEFIENGPTFDSMILQELADV